MEKIYKLTFEQLNELLGTYSDYPITQSDLEERLKDIQIRKKVKLYEEKLRKKRQDFEDKLRKK